MQQRALRLVDNQQSEVRRQKPVKNTDVRASTLRAIHATWRKINPDLEGEDLRDARLQFATQALGLKKPLTSTSKLSPAQLGRVLDEMRRHERAPGLPGMDTTTEGTEKNKSTSPVVDAAEVHHLATQAQVDVIRKLIRHLNWSAVGTQAFLTRTFKRTSEAMLTPQQANSCTMILFNIAGRKRIADRLQKTARESQAAAMEAGRVAQKIEMPKISRALIQSEIPALKRELGIDQKPFSIEE